jgi:hypothetical protein
MEAAFRGACVFPCTFLQLNFHMKNKTEKRENGGVIDH